MCALGLAVAALAGDDLEAAEHWADLGCAAFDRIGARVQSATARNILGEVARAAGDPIAAEHHYRQAATQHQALGSTTGERIALLNVGILLVLRGATEEVETIVGPVAAALEVEGAHLFLGPAMLMLGAADLHLGRLDAWERRWTAARRWLDETGLVHADVVALATHLAGLLQARGADEAPLRALAETQQAALVSAAARPGRAPAS